MAGREESEAERGPFMTDGAGRACVVMKARFGAMQDMGFLQCHREVFVVYGKVRCTEQEI